MNNNFEEMNILIEIKVAKSKFPANLDMQESLELNDSDEELSRIDGKYSKIKNHHNHNSANNLSTLNNT